MQVQDPQELVVLSSEEELGLGLGLGGEQSWWEEGGGKAGRVERRGEEMKIRLERGRRHGLVLE